MGMNARNYLYIHPYNPQSKIKIADDKLLTKELLLANKIPTPALLASFRNRKDVYAFDWKLPQHGFVIKPARGYGGAGIVPVMEWFSAIAVTVSGEKFSQQQLQSHILDILEGSYSLQFLPDSAFIENIIVPDQFLKKIAPIGLADIRVIVFNSIPVMAMMRIPTVQSKGKANLHLGAIACGIDIRTGITTFGVSRNRLVDTIPGTKVRTGGIKIPRWDDILLIATKTQNILGLGYAGVDLVLDTFLGPSVLEVNARPGLNIQIANQDSLRTRLERIADMDITSPERGIEIAKSLFAENTLQKPSSPVKVLTVAQPIKIVTDNKTQKIEAKLDTGALRSSIDEKLARELGLKKNNREVFVKSASGQSTRNMVDITFILAGKKIKTAASVINRNGLEFPMIVGRRDLKDFLIKPILREHVPDIDENERMKKRVRKSKQTGKDTHTRTESGKNT